MSEPVEQASTGSLFSERNVSQRARFRVQAVVDAAQGAPGAREVVEALFEPLTEGGYLLEKPIRRIWAGERDVWALTEELDRTDALIVGKILAALAGETDNSGR